MLCRRLALVAVCLSLATVASAQTYTLWHSPIGFRNNDVGVTLSEGSPGTATRITSTSTGSKWIFLGLTVPTSAEWDSLTVCYEKSSANVYITQTRTTRMSTPDAAFIYLDNGTDRTDNGPTCYTVNHPGQFPDDVITLALRIQFDSTVGEWIEIGAIGVKVTETGGAAPGTRPGIE